MTMSSEYQRFYDDARPHVPGVIQTTMQAELFGAFREFFQRSNAWQEDITVAITANNLTYPLTVTSGKMIYRLINLYNSTDIEKRWVWPAQMNTPGVLQLNRVPTEPHTWVATVSLYPVDTLDTDGNPVAVPQVFLSQYFEQLKSGLLSNLMMQPNKPYTNMQLATYHKRVFNNGWQQAIIDRTRANTYGTQAWGYPYGGTTSGRQRGV